MIVGSITVVRLLGAPNARAGASRTPFGATRSLLLGPAAVPEALPLGSLHSSPWLEESAAAAGRSILAEPTSAGGRDTTSSKKALALPQLRRDRWMGACARAWVPPARRNDASQAALAHCSLALHANA